MQRQPAELAARWLEQAESDLEAARDQGGRYHLVCFLAQQSAEKALKGVLVWERGDFPRIHLIRELLRELDGTKLRIDPALASQVLTLDKYYLTTRYPDVLDYASPAESFSAEEAEHATAITAKLLAVVRAHLTSAGAIVAKRSEP
jgi:HEPN domain-containing protein